MHYNFVTVEGNIGAGKTTLATKLAGTLNGNLVLEQFSSNPFLPLFYKEPGRYAFSLELFFMAERYKQLNEKIIAKDMFSSFSVSDYLFVKSLLFSKVNLTNEEYKLFQQLFNIICKQLPKAGLLLYLHTPVDKLLENIGKRGRDYERNIKGDYLSAIETAYFDYMKQLTDTVIVIVNAADLDFINNNADFEFILQLLRTEFKKGMNYA
jgi:deoxyguanosine kinase